mmetsp:Transcript_1484/g.4350  ORF Transcript_1484/g.4350 Transcript_1484/m.4350 type:complete len:168 (+) Transcript_1484:267-770(+)
MLFDAVLDTVGEASRAVGLLREGGGLCSIIASPSVEGVRAWVDESKVEPRRVTLGVATFLNSSLGGWAFNAVTGARRLRARCAARGAGYSSVIGTGDGEVAAELGRLLEEGGLEAVLDKAFPLTRCAEALEELRRGRTCGKIVIAVTAEAERECEGRSLALAGASQL